MTLLLISTPLLASEEVKWTEVAIPTQGKPGNWLLASGSDVQHLTMAIDGTLYAYGKGLTYTLYKSTDDGDTWSYIGDVRDAIVDIAIASDNPNIIYYATTATVYRSTDGGKTFSSLPSGPGGAGSNNIEITAIAITRLNNYIIAVATRDKDNAQFGGVYTLDETPIIPSWVNTGLAGYDVYALAFSPNYLADRQLVAVVTNEANTFVMSKVGGAGWGATIGSARLDRDNSGTPTPVIVANSAAIAFPGDYDATAADSLLFIAIDTGTGNGDVYQIEVVAAPTSSVATDLNIGAGYGLSNVDVTGLAVSGDSAAAKLMAGAASSAQVSFSDDSGETWTKSRKEPTGGGKTCLVLAADFATSGRAFAATSGSDSAFSVTLNSGTIWNQVGLIDTSISNIIDLAPSPDFARDNTLFLLTFGSEHSLWRGSRGAWERIFSGSLPNVDSLDLVRLPPQYDRSRPVIFLAGSASGSPAIWKSTDNGQSFTRRPTADPDSGASFAINAWAIVDDNTLFIGSFDGTNGRVYQTTNSGFFYAKGTIVGSQSLNSIVLSPDYGQDKTVLVGNTGGWVYISRDNGASFEPLPPNATSPPLTDSISVAFDPRFSSNHTVYAASNTANKGIYRFIVGRSTEWERIDSALPTGATINQLILSPEGALYATNSQANGGMERCLDPTYSLGPTFETVTRGLSPSATLFGLWGNDHQLWASDNASAKLMTFPDSLTSPVPLVAPIDKATITSTLVNNVITNVSLDWESLPGATTYKWQLDYDTDFSTVPGGFEGTTKATSVRLPGLDPATTYYWRVRVTEPALSPWSEKWSFATSLTTDAVSLKLESPEPGAKGVAIKPVFQCSSIAGAQAYELLVASDNQFANPSIAKVSNFALPSTAWQCNVNLNYNTTYYWKVRAIGAGTTSDWSAASAFTTESQPPPPPPSSAPSVIAPVPSPQTLLVMPPATAPLPPPPPAPSASAPETPEWVVYLIAALLLTNLLLVITILVLVITIRRL